MTTTETSTARDWLAHADADPDRIYRWWESGAAALIALGRRFDVVRLDGALAAWATQRLPDGPVMQLGSPEPRLYLLVPPGSWPRFSSPLATLLGDTEYLAMNDPDATTNTGRPDIRWITPPDGTGRLVDPVELRRLVDSYAPEQPR